MSSEFRLPPPPRVVPAQLAIITMMGSIIAWLLLAFSSLFLFFFCANADLSFLTFRPPYQEAQGTVIESKPTNAKENNARIYAIGYSYHVQGVALAGTSYVVADAPEAGEKVTIEYLAGEPLKSRIAGMRRNLWSPWILLVGLFPAACLGLVIFNVRTGLRRCRLLRDGMVATGRLIERQRTSMTINRQRVYKLIYEFESYDGRTLTASARSHRPDRFRDQEPLLYDPLEPSRSVLIASLPMRPDFGAQRL